MGERWDEVRSRGSPDEGRTKELRDQISTGE